MNRRCVLHCFLFLACASLALPTSSFSNETPTGPLKIDYTRPVEHQEMEEYEGPSTCEDCHEGVVDQVIRSTHYTWAPKFRNGGKYSGLQMTAVPINWLGILNKEKHIPGGCGRCHIGGGPMPISPSNLTEADKEKIDCLICHAQNYNTKVRYPRLVNGQWVIPQDRSLEAARSVGRTTQDMCLRCHYVTVTGYKRGADLKEDVHYKKGMGCTRCHRVYKHEFPGFGPTITEEVNKRVKCTDCHDFTPHKNKTLNKHVRLDCRTCHIVEAGGVVYKNGTQSGIYDEKTGLYKISQKMGTSRPFYFWYDGVSHGPMPKGSIDDSTSKIQPFKKFVGVAPVDSKTGAFLWLKLGVFAKTGDVDKAVEAGVKANGHPYSGSWNAKKYAIYYQLSHAVTRKHALRCKDCHSPNGVMDFKALGYSKERIAKLTKKK